MKQWAKREGQIERVMGATVGMYVDLQRINAMKTNKLERLKAGGWEVGNAEDFLQLSDEEARLVALKLSLISAAENHASNASSHKLTWRTAALL